ncbi:MAG TPA: DUF4838 domain-containing protein [Planctomycetota bacterium]|nr:DUF4838 domain-containing protein [Planctomycetota bacterium]
MKAFPMIALSMFTAHVLAADAPKITLADAGKTDYVIVCIDPSPSEKHAAEELAHYLKQISGATFEIVPALPAGKPFLAVGAAAAKRAHETDLKELGNEGILITSTAGNIVFSGGAGASRGTLYAVYTFLEDCCGVRWWAPDAESVPKREKLQITVTNTRFVPVFEYRDPFIKVAFDAKFAARNKINGPYRQFSDAQGGGIEYAGFVHTFYELAPPQDHFAKLPQWYSEIKGKRIHEKGQLCLTNPELLAFVKQRVRQWIKDNPKASIVSISQNDWLNGCQCRDCAKADAEEGTPSGTLLKFVNAIAEDLEKDFPHIAVDTLAYQYTRKPPKTVRPRDNVIIRLCSIECSFLQPLDHDANKAFREDMEAWSKICKRLYVWDYVINFSHYLMPHPNLRVLEPNIRFFVKHNVKGVLEQGNNRAFGGEFEELKAWVLAKLLWNPELKAEALIDEFLTGFYGAAAPKLREYIQLLHDRAEKTGFYLPIDEQTFAPYLDVETLTAADKLLQEALATVGNDPVLKKRVECATLQTRYVFALRWPHLKKQAELKQQTWPRAISRDELIKDVVHICGENNIGALFEDWSGDTVPHTETLVQRYGGRRDPPQSIKELDQPGAIDLQDELFTLWHRPKQALWKLDEKASDGKAVWMPGDHRNWNIYLPVSDSVFSAALGKSCTAYAVVRVEKSGDDGVAFTAGVYDTGSKNGACEIAINVRDVREAGYILYKMGTVTPNKAQYFWAAPAENGKNVKSVWVDRFILLPAP